MQIFTIDDLDFPVLLEAFQAGKPIGRYWRDGKVQLVYATTQFVFVAQGEKPEKLALKPARGLFEAEEFALRLLAREKERGSQVVVADEFQKD